MECVARPPPRGPSRHAEPARSAGEGSQALRLAPHLSSRQTAPPPLASLLTRALPPAQTPVLPVLDCLVPHSYLFSPGGFIRMKLRLVVLLCLAGSAGSAVFAEQASAPRLIAVDDVFGAREVQDPQISPDGQFIAYTVSSTSLKDDKSEKRIWMLPAAGGDAVPLTSEGVSSDHPRWSPDGKFLAFLSERKEANGIEGKTQVYLLNRLGGEAQRLTDTPQDVEDFVWSPDGKRLVLILRDPSPEELEAAASKVKEKEEDGADKPATTKKAKAQRPWVIDRLYFKEDTVGYLDRRRTHLYAFHWAAKSTTQISAGDCEDTDPSWSPDGKLLAFASNRSKPDPDATYASNIWVVAAENMDQGATPTQVTNG